MDESENLLSLIEDIELQDYPKLTLVACVNQYDHWWKEEKNLPICTDNKKSLEILQDEKKIPITIIDKSTKGKGWKKKKGGVGFARKTIKDHISGIANPNDIIISIDGDTSYPSNYASAIADFFKSNKKALGLALPYYHKLSGNITDRLILRYEIYMRYYLLNMLRINNPYAFTAIGSAMACTVASYKKAGGLTPVMSGEDFYFLQKLAKTGNVGIWCNTIAYPSSRFSNRVLFGTGPALIKGNTGDWSSYPIYHFDFFNEVEETFKGFFELYENIEKQLAMETFLRKQFNDENIWSPIRNNYKDINNFIKGCYNKVDALRILQYLRNRQPTTMWSNEKILLSYLEKYHREFIEKNSFQLVSDFDFQQSDIDIMSSMRELLFEIETEERKKLQ